MSTLDLNILPIRRLNGQESAEMPGLLAVAPPRKTARGREQNSLVIYLTLSGNATLSTPDLRRLTSDAAALFYQSSGPLTSAIHHVAEDINSKLLARNVSTTGQGQQVLGLLVVAALRANQCTILLSGPTHAVWVTDGQSRHIYEPALSGKGLGSGQNLTAYLSQVELHPQDLLVLCANFPRDWEADLLNERPPASLDASYRKLTFTKGDLNAILIQSQNGNGTITILRPAVKAATATPSPSSGQPAPVPSPEVAPTVSDDPTPDTIAPIAEEAVATETAEILVTDEHKDQTPVPPAPATEEQVDSLANIAAHMVQPSAYAIPPQAKPVTSLPEEENQPAAVRGFPASIPRAKPDGLSLSKPAEQEAPVEPVEQDVEAEPQVPAEEEAIKPPPRARRRRRLFRPNAHAEATRQIAKTMVGGFKVGRRMNEGLRGFLQRFVPRLLPSGEPNQSLVIPTYILFFIAVVIPVIVVTVASVVYLRFGQSIQYDELYGQALNMRAQAMSEGDPSRQRDAWRTVLTYLNQADEYRQTDESRLLRTEAQSKLDNLMGVIRLEFVPAFPNGLTGSPSGQITRMAASESDLYMLDADGGKILHATFTGRSLDLDNAFNCQPGSYSGYQVGPLVDVLALPKVNALNATVLGIDDKGTLLYCAPDQVPQAIPLPSLPNTNWGHITSFALDSGYLYVLDAQQRSVWIFTGKDSTFIDPPTFYFGNEIPPNIQSAIDLAVSGEDLYMLHTDGHLSTCRLSPLSEVPTRCQDPAPRVDNNPAHRDIDIFQLTHFTQISITNPPSSVILLLDSENQTVFRFLPRSFELQSQISSYTGKGNPFQKGSATAMAVSPNYVLYLAIGDQVYFATNLP